MASSLLNPVMTNQEQMLASGDATCTDNLVLSPSLTNLLPNPDTEIPEKKNTDIGRCETFSTQKQADGCGATSPRFFPIGSLRKTQYEDSIQRQKKITLKCFKKVNKPLNINNENPKGSHSNECFTPREYETALNFEKLAKLFTCQACQTSPMASMTIHMCKQGHQICGTCFIRESCKCTLCGEPLEGRNKPVEAALEKLKLLCPELFLLEFLTLSPADDLDESFKKAVYLSSHRPFKCPNFPCRRMVAYNGFLVHFQIEHPTVPLVSVAPNYPNRFSLAERSLNDKGVKALTVFKVNLMSRINPRKYVESGDPVICCLLSVPLQIGCVNSLAIWCSGIYEGTSPPLTYSVKTPHCRKSITYQAPVASLHESTKSILEDGKCLILASEMLENFPLHYKTSNIFQIEFFIKN